MLAVAGCSNPSAATPVPPPPPTDPLTLTCPSPISQFSSTGQPMTVHYTAATSSGGTAPVEISCTPSSDAIFPVGATPVTCRASDTRLATAACSFTVTVVAPPKLTLTNFIAFGDSITAGEIVSESSIGGIRLLRVDDAKSYPTDLKHLLDERYTPQSPFITMKNAGFSAENTTDGLARLPRVLSSDNQVLLLMEGANDLADRDSVTMRLALSNIDAMVRIAKSRGMRVLLATLPPERPGNCTNRGFGESLVPPYNDGLKVIVSNENIALVDVYAAFNGDASTLIDCDGLHPTADGYQKIAETFLNTIKQTLETPVASLTPSWSRPTLPTLKGQPFVAPRKR